MNNHWDYNLAQLWNGALVASVAHAVGSARYPDLSSMQSWERDNYSFQDYMGTHGTICFTVSQERKPLSCVGGVVGRKSARSTSIRSSPDHAASILASVPRELSALSNELPGYFLVNSGGTTYPVLTSLMWSEGNDIISVDTWADFIQYGGGHVQNLLEPPDLVLFWSQQYGLSDKEVELVESLLENCRANLVSKRELTQMQHKLLESYSSKGYSESVLLLRQLGMN